MTVCGFALEVVLDVESVVDPMVGLEPGELLEESPAEPDERFITGLSESLLVLDDWLGCGLCVLAVESPAEPGARFNTGRLSSA